MIALGSNVHIFARPHRREELARCLETVSGGSPVRTVEFPGIDQPMLMVSFPGGGHLSIEFTDNAPDDDQPRLGAWLELRADDPPAVLRAALDAGLIQVKHPGHPYYFMIPGGQVFTIAPTSSTAPAWRRPLSWMKKKDGSDLYSATKPPAKWLKAIVQMLIGVGTLATLMVLVWIPHLRAVGIGELALRIVGTGLALSAVVELTYTLFTDGPDEALDPLTLGLSSFILLKISDPNTGLYVRNASTIVLLVVALAGLFVLRKIFIRESDGEHVEAKHKVSQTGDAP
jgi:hypothetical protein